MEDDPFADLLDQIDSEDPPKASLLPSTQKQQTKQPKNPFDAFNVPFDMELNPDDPFDTSNISEVWRNPDQISKAASPPTAPIMNEDFSRQPESLYPSKKASQVFCSFEINIHNSFRKIIYVYIYCRLILLLNISAVPN